MTTNIHNSSGHAKGAAQIQLADATNDKSHSTILLVMLEALPKFHRQKPINDKSCPNSTTNNHDSSGYAGGAAQIQHVNTINDKSRPNLTTNIHASAGYAGGAAQIPQANTIKNKS